MIHTPGLRTYQCLVVDDNRVAAMLLQQLLLQIPDISIAGICENAAEADSFLANNTIDLMFLDIEMPGMSGLDLLRSLSKKPLTILTSANKGYALEAFELNVVDYIVKPVMLPRLHTAVRRAVELIRQEQVLINNFETDHIFIKDGKAIRKIIFDEIYFMEAMGDYVKIHLADKYLVIHATLKLLEEKLSTRKFTRVHRSYLVALDKIEYIEDNVLYLNSVPVPLSEFYKTKVLAQLNFL